MQCNNNAFALEIDAADGPLTGASIYCAAAPQKGVCPPVDPNVDEALVGPNGDAVFANRPHSTDLAQPKLVTRNDPTSWRFWWTAPSSGTGAVTIYVAAVTDASGRKLTLVSNQAGNFYTDESVAFPAFVEIHRGAAVRHMEPSIENGSCASCHQQLPLTGAEGRVFIAPSGS